jgi:hypothetical protein
MVSAGTFPYKFDQAKRKGFAQDVLGGDDLLLKNRRPREGIAQD